MSDAPSKPGRATDPLALVIGVAGLALLALAALSVPQLDSLPVLLRWYLSALGFGAIGLAVAASRGAWRFGLLLFVLVAGGAAQLALTKPLWFPEIKLRAFDPVSLAFWAIIVGQAGVTLFALLQSRILSHVPRFVRTFGPLRILAFLALTALFSVSVMGYAGRGAYLGWILQVVAQSALLGLNLLTLIALLAAPPPRGTGKTFHPLVPAIIATVLSAGLAWFSFERLPHVEDEVAFIFQAKTLASGALTVPAPPADIHPALEYYLFDIRDGRWFAVTPPGWPMTLALGMALGLPWLVNPLLAGLSVLLAYGVVARFVHRDRARLVALLMATSPWFLATAASLMPHMIALAMTLLAWWLLLGSGKTARARLVSALVAGLAMGWVFTTRQLEGAILGTLTGLWLLARWRETGALPRIFAYGLGCVLTGAVYLAYNLAMTGDPLLDPLARYLNDQWHQGANAYGFGPEIGPPSGWGGLDLAQGHSPFEGLVSIQNNAFNAHLELLGWTIGGLALVWVALLWRRWDRLDRAMAAIVVVIVGALFFYWFSGSFYIGPRYWFSLLLPFLVLTAGGFMTLKSRLAEADLSPQRLDAGVLVLCFFAVSVFLPWRAALKYHEFGNFHSAAREEAATGNLDGALVFFNKPVHHGSAFALNDPWMRADRPLFLRDLGAEANTDAVHALPGRKVIYLTLPE